MNYLIGAGGHATVIKNIASKNNFHLDGVFYDGDGQNLTMLKKVGNMQDIKNYIFNNQFIIAFGDIANRVKLIKNLEKENIQWFTLIDPSAIIGNDVEIGKNTVIMPGAIINAGAKIGNHVIINSGAIIEHGCIIEDYVHISPGSTICGNSVIKEGSWVGANSVVINAIEIGRNVTIGAGSVVINNIESNQKVVGNPAKILVKK